VSGRFVVMLLLLLLVVRVAGALVVVMGVGVMMRLVVVVDGRVRFVLGVYRKRIVVSKQRGTAERHVLITRSSLSVCKWVRKGEYDRA
jgi:hypothetical protein